MKDNQHEQLFTELTGIAGVHELDNEAAAAIQGGDALELYRDIGLKGSLGSFNFGGKRKLNANDQISSIRINEGTWEFYEHDNYGGKVLQLGRGRYDLILYPFGFSFATWNDKISSFKRIR